MPNTQSAEHRANAPRDTDNASRGAVFGFQLFGKCVHRRRRSLWTNRRQNYSRYTIIDTPRHCENTNLIRRPRRVDDPHGIENNNNRLTIIIIIKTRHETHNSESYSIHLCIRRYLYSCSVGERTMKTVFNENTVHARSRTKPLIKNASSTSCLVRFNAAAGN